MPTPKIFFAATILFDRFDLSGALNQVGLPLTAEEKDFTNFASRGWKEGRVGIIGGEWSMTGFNDALLTEAPLWDQITSRTHVPLVVSETNPMAVGDIVWSTWVRKTSFKRDNPVGEPSRFDATFTTDKSVLRGKCLGYGDEVSATGNGTGQNLGAVSTTQTVVAVLQVLAVGSGTPNMVVKVQSDGDNTFGSAADQITFAAVTSDPSTWSQRLEIPAGVAITDTWWRELHTITDGDFDYRVAFFIE
jgi:hypothetical protein